MRFSKAQELLLLFVDLKNPIWNTLLGHPPTQADINSILGLSTNTITNWRKGKKISLASPSRIFANTLRLLENSEISTLGDFERKTLSEVVEKYKALYFSKNQKIIDAAEILGMNIDDCRKVIDEAIYERFPLFPEMYYSTDSDREIADANEEFAKYGGLYQIGIKRNDFWLICSLRIRYVVEIGDGKLLRCKMNLPNTQKSDDQKYWSYDGFVIPRGSNMFWIFEQRQTPINDYFFFITCSGSYMKNSLTMAGTYLTAGQDRYRTIANDEILLIKMAENRPQAMEEKMREMVTPLTNQNDPSEEAEREKYNQMLDDFKKFRDHK